MRGLPASGKSTKAKGLMACGNTVRVNKDLLRTMLHFDKYNYRNEEITRSVSIEVATQALTMGLNVIIDDTNLKPGTVESWKGFLRGFNDLHGTDHKIEYQECFDITVDECVERDILRDKKVGAHVIQKMALQYLDYMKDEDVVICDLDGTLCDIEHRLHFAKSSPKNWKSFFGSIDGDDLREEIWEKVKSVKAKQIIFVSARPETYRRETELWLSDNDIYNYILIMREAHDKRPDTEVKSDIYEKYLKKLNIIKVFDDRPSVIRMWKEKGLEVEDCGGGVEF